MRFSHVAACALILLALSGSCSKKKIVRTVEMGEKAEIGPFLYQAYDTAWPMSLGERVPKDHFLIVKLTVVNSGAGDATIPSIDLVDDSDKTIPELSDGTGVENWLGMARTLHPGETAHGEVVFDAAPRQYRLRVADEGDDFMYIRMPLNMNSEAPQGQPQTAAPQKK